MRFAGTSEAFHLGAKLRLRDLRQRLARVGCDFPQCDGRRGRIPVQALASPRTSVFHGKDSDASRRARNSSDSEIYDYRPCSLLLHCSVVGKRICFRPFGYSVASIAQDFIEDQSQTIL